MALKPYQKMSYSIVRALIWEKLTISLSLPIDHIVAYGSRILKLDSGEKIPMPNVVRRVTRSTMVKQYQSFCEEEMFQSFESLNFV